MTPQLVVADLVRHLLSEVERDRSVAPCFQRRSDARELWRSLLFAILSSQVRVSTATKAADYILSDIPFFGCNDVTRTEVYRRTLQILRSEGIRHRFPNAKANQIADSWFAFGQLSKNLYAYLDSFSSEKNARAAVSKLFPGLGIKQASMFLRDIGYSDRLCVIDTHILWYCSRLAGRKLSTLTPKRYEELEEYLLGESTRLNVPPNTLDTVIWTAVRTFKAAQCTMRFA
jgi:N-glycosylase/DNA lyase